MCPMRGSVPGRILICIPRVGNFLAKFQVIDLDFDFKAILFTVYEPVFKLNFIHSDDLSTFNWRQ